MIIDEEKIPILDEVKGACEILGLDPLYIANEGKMIAIISSDIAEEVLSEWRKKELGKENYNKIRTNKVKDVKLTLKQKKYISRINRLAKKEQKNRRKIGDKSILGRKKK